MTRQKQTTSDSHLDTRQINRLRSHLLAWFEENRRELPWRENRDPYGIWVSEIMLQQTRVAVVIERYKAFMERFPTLIALALAPEQEVLALWSGLGYYRRARMLHKAAQSVASQFQGNLPLTATELRMLPGIGDYTAAAIASIAHNEPVAVVDGNVERVICRLCGWHADAPEAAALRRRIRTEANRLLDPHQPGTFNQAMMELGALVCTPRSPQCSTCPMQTGCLTRGEHRMPARPRMKSCETAWALILRPLGGGLNHEILLCQRAETESVMPGLWELPALAAPEVPEADLRLSVQHTIMQTRYYARIRTMGADELPALAAPGVQPLWIKLTEASQMALTGLTRKVLTRLRLISLPQAVIKKPAGG